MPGVSNYFLGAALLLASPATCLTAWWTALSPHLAMQNLTTGNIMYTACNSNSTPIFPTDGSNFFRLQRKPRIGTALAAAGWYDVEGKTTVASMFFQAQDGSIVNGYYVCDFPSGHYVLKGEYTVSATAGVESIHNETGLSVELLGAEDGYRVFFHDENKRVNVLSYTTKTDWQLKDPVSQDPVGGMALTSAHSGQLNMSVVYAKDAENFETARFFKDATWRLDTLPRPLVGGLVNGKTNASNIVLDPSLKPNFTLPAFASSLTGLDMIIDRANVRSILYVGTDSKLHQVSDVDDQWKLMPDQDPGRWPVADAADGPFAATSNYETNEAWVWYPSNGNLAQLYQGSDGSWTQATTVPSVNATATASPNEAEKAVVLSAGAKAGIGIGISLAVAAVAGFGLFLLKRRRRKQAAAAAEAARLKEAEAMANGWGAPSPMEKHGSEVFEADASTAPQELMDTVERYELVGEGHWREMDATGQNGARRSIGGWREAQKVAGMPDERK
ncbi:hypothetical protein LX32DRAFT_662644 [Colletotrichum zoysiae]|uniref:Uncharacterized protein n=1 Tax=Colletotrichum zoysiae TaxID=1216348 RepID=A0AAD9HM22_9PEZI|nr:hypothetical protein LX32DRAFT_662644 [Colletotrichum zoysiae]